MGGWAILALRVPRAHLLGLFFSNFILISQSIRARCSHMLLYCTHIAHHLFALCALDATHHRATFVQRKKGGGDTT